MDTLRILEQKLSTLMTLVRDLKTSNAQLNQEKLTLQVENEELKAENAKLAEENAQLLLQIEGWQTSTVKENEEVEELVDDLIKSIDSLKVECENQQ